MMALFIVYILINFVIIFLDRQKKYFMVTLCINHKPQKKRVHRVVAETFISNPDNLPQINHKNENTFINTVDNLEWCTASYNINYGTRIERQRKTLKETWKKKKKAKKINKKINGFCEEFAYFLLKNK